MAKKKFEELNLKDAFLFGAVLEDPETCRLVLEVVLGRSVEGITVHAEHTLFYSSDYRSIRLDIYAEDDERKHYNVEMQGENKGNLPKRSRFHQADMDVTNLNQGEDFDSLPPSYVIFICAFDPFDQGLYRYTFENRCLERDFPLEDGAIKVFLSTKGKNADQVPAELVNFLRYVEESTNECVQIMNDEVVYRLHERVTSLKRSKKWRKQYMRFEELLQDAEKQGREEGCEETQKRLCVLIARMTEAGEADRLSMLSDADFLNEMFLKYQI